MAGIYGAEIWFLDGTHKDFRLVKEGAFSLAAKFQDGVWEEVDGHHINPASVKFIRPFIDPDPDDESEENPKERTYTPW